MKFSIAAVALLLTAFSSSSSCHAREAFHFYQTATGEWKPAARKPVHPAALADIVCKENGAKVNMIWYSESGDWTAYDKYASVPGQYFVRTMKFAQFPIAATVIKATPSAEAKVSFSGPSAEVSEYQNTTELPEVRTFDRVEAFPFRLPQCARAAFQRTIQQ
jgi:hypothetical protein